MSPESATNAPAEATSERTFALRAVVAATLVGSLYQVYRWFIFDELSFDTPVIHNVVWRLANGHDDRSLLNGAHHFAEHVSPVLLFLIPIELLSDVAAVPIFLVLQVVSAALAVWAGWTIAGDRGVDPSTQRVLLLTALVGPPFFLMASSSLHATGLVIGPLAMAVANAIGGRRRLTFAAWATIVALARPEMAFVIALLAVPLRHLGRKAHAAIALSIGLGLAVVELLWGALNAADGLSVSAHLAHLGEDGVFGTLLAAPHRLLIPTGDLLFWFTAALWAVLFGVRPLIRSWRWIVPAVPMLAIPAIGVWGPADLPTAHYWHVLLPLGMTAVAMATGDDQDLARRYRWLAPRAALVMWIYVLFLPDAALPHLPDDVSDARAAVAAVEAAGYADVSADPRLVPRLANRPGIHAYGLPFVCAPFPNYQQAERAPEAVVTHSSGGERRAELDRRYDVVEAIGDFEIWELTGPDALTPVPPCDSSRYIQNLFFD